MKELSENEVNPAIYHIYLEDDTLIKWIEKDNNNNNLKLYKLIGEEIMKTYVKEIFNEILIKYDDMVFKKPYDIENYKLVKYDIKLTNERLIK